MREESFWQTLRRSALRTWPRDLVAYPVVALLTMLGMVLLYGREWEGHVLEGIVIALLAWPVALWLLDRIFGRYHTPS